MSISSHMGRFSPPMTDTAGRIPLIGLTLPEMTATMETHKLPAFRAKQIWHWIYRRGVQNFEDMVNLPKDMRTLLTEKHSIKRANTAKEQRSTDGTIKWLLSLSDGQQIETVFIPETKRGTLCISSQVGCTLSCKFCHTGTQPLVRNLGTHEILQQIMHARDALNEWPRAGDKQPDKNPDQKPKQEQKPDQEQNTKASKPEQADQGKDKDDKTAAGSKKNMLNRLEDKPGKAMMQILQKRRVEKDW